jgi:hypothetical protein
MNRFSWRRPFGWFHHHDRLNCRGWWFGPLGYWTDDRGGYCLYLMPWRKRLLFREAD